MIMDIQDLHTHSTLNKGRGTPWKTCASLKTALFVGSLNDPCGEIEHLLSVNYSELP